MKKLYKYILLFLLFAESLSSQTVLPGSITGIYEIYESGNPYIIDKELIIESFASFIVHQGVEIQIKDNKCIQVFGNIIAKGTKEKPIIFKEDKNQLTWRGFLFFEGSANNKFNNVIIKNAEIYSKNSDLSFINCSFINENKDLVLPYLYIKNSKFFYDSCFMISNSTGNGIVIDVGKDVIVKNSIFEDVPDAIEYMEVFGGLIENNKITNSIDDCIDLNGSQDIIIKNNLINGAVDKGISIGNNNDIVSKNITISKNVIINTNSAITVKGNSEVTIINNTFHNNDYAVYCYERDANMGGGGATVLNTIFSDCKQNTFTDTLSSITINYCLSNSEKLTGDNNLQDDPGFYDSNNNDFRLRKVSPCIDAGDPDSEPDNDGTRADIGAFYFNQIPKIVINEINYNSSPNFDSGDWLEIYNNENSDVDISNWMIKGSDDLNMFRFPDNSILATNSYFVISSDSIKFKTIFNDANNLYCNFNFSLNDSGESVSLIDDKDKLIDFVEYDSKPPWDSLANGKGLSLELLNPNLDNSLAENWKSSITFGTPGNINERYLSDSEDTITLTNKIQFELIPNPVINISDLQITIDNDVIATIMIFDNLGNNLGLLFLGILEKGINIIPIDMTKYSSGIYYISIYSENRYYYGKIIHL